MFSDKKKSNQPNTTSAQTNILGASTKIVGDIESDGDFRIDATVEGTITTSGKVVIGKLGKVTGTIKAANADIEGVFSGDLFVEQLLTVRKTATISGNVQIAKLAVEPDASFNATCTMKTGVKNIKNAEKTA